MKVAQKHNPLRNDCFEASERGVRVRIAAHRNIILVDVNGAQAELKLDQLAWLLRDADKLSKIPD